MLAHLAAFNLIPTNLMSNPRIVIHRMWDGGRQPHRSFVSHRNADGTIVAGTRVHMVGLSQRKGSVAALCRLAMARLGVPTAGRRCSSGSPSAPGKWARPDRGKARGWETLRPT
jgi:hypothetical protein